jgi:AcrR family transcriptional regulator
MSKQAQPRGSARARLLAAADELFPRAGIHATGVDEAVGRAGVATATLYAQFGGKDALVAAYLADRHERWMRRWDSHINTARTPADRLTAIFDALADWARADGLVRGCAFSDAAAEIADRTHPAWDVITTHKRALHHRLRELAEQAGLDAPDDAATDLLLIYEGALVGCLLGHLDAPIDHAKTLAMHVVASRRVRARPAGRKRPHPTSR